MEPPSREQIDRAMCIFGAILALDKMDPTGPPLPRAITETASQTHDVLCWVTGVHNEFQSVLNTLESVMATLGVEIESVPGGFKVKIRRPAERAEPAGNVPHA